jgi:hypothetical protein
MLDATPRAQRPFIVRVAIMATIAAILVTGLSATQASAVTTPTFVAGSAANGFAGPGNGTGKPVTITSSNVQAGDLWVGIASYYGDGTAIISGSGWNAPAPYNAERISAIYGVRAWIFWKVLTPADVVGGKFTSTVTSGGDGAQFGGIRYAGVAYRGSNLTATVSGDAVHQSAGTGSYADATFPAVAPPSVNNVVLRLGAARGYGGYLAGHTIKWTSAPGTVRNESSQGNYGDRALVVSEQVNSNGAAAAGRYDTALWGSRNRVTYSIAITSQG